MVNEHYQKTLKNGNKTESIDYIQGIMKDKFQYGCWFNVLKYPVRVYDKHETPIPDIKKTMHYCLFWLNDLYGKQASYNQQWLFDIFDNLGLESEIDDLESESDDFEDYEDNDDEEFEDDDDDDDLWTNEFIKWIEDRDSVEKSDNKIKVNVNELELAEARELFDILFSKSTLKDLENLINNVKEDNKNES